MICYYWDKYTWDNKKDDWEYDDYNGPYGEKETVKESVMSDIFFYFGHDFELKWYDDKVEVWNNYTNNKVLYEIKETEEK